MNKRILNIILIVVFALAFRFFSGSNSSPKPANITPTPTPSVQVTQPNGPIPSSTLSAPSIFQQSLSSSTSMTPDTSLELADDVLAKNYLVILDDSGSMKGQKMQEAKEAMTIFCQSVPHNANLGLATFKGDCSVKVPLGQNNRSEFLAAVQEAKATEGTPLCRAITKASEELSRQKLRQLEYGEYHLVIVTDGASSDGDPRQIVESINRTSAIVIHTIGFQIGTNHSLNQSGKVLYQSAQNKTELSKMLDNVLAESNEYSDITTF
jgi:Ca-activated chloride channel homolog